MRPLAGLIRQDEDRLTAGFEPEQRDALRDLLTKLASQLGLTPHAHVAYRALNG